VKLASLFTFQSQFVRSINIQGDIENGQLASQYVWSENNLSLVEEVLSELEDETKQGAISLTGPFGSGKSAFAIQLIHLLGGAGEDIKESALNRLNSSSSNLADKIRNQFSRATIAVPIIGRQGSIEQCIIEGLKDALKKEGIPPNKLSIYLNRCESNNEAINFKELFQIFDSLICEKFDQVILLIDEFGKLLEYTALNPNSSDIYVLQQLAELRKSDFETKLLIMTFLHQSFEGYASFLSKESQTEWSKIQGRFRNLNLLEHPVQTIGLIQSSIKPTANAQKKSKILAKINSTALDRMLSNLPNSFLTEDEELKRYLKNCLPFHPMTLLLMPFLSKGLGQNNRSCFTFLGNKSQSSARDWCEKAEYTEEECFPFISVSQLFDYFVQNQSQLSLKTNNFAKVNVALEKLSSEQLLEAKILKLVSLLNFINKSSILPASPELIENYFMSLGFDNAEVTETINHLKENSFLIYRKFSNEFRLWEGSDFDLSEAIAKEETKQQLQIEDLISELSQSAKFAPIVAKRHYANTGTLRHYVQRFFSGSSLDAKTLAKTLESTLKSGAEGLIIHLVSSNQEEYLQNQKLAQSINEANVVIFVGEANIPLLSLLKEHKLLKTVSKTDSSLSNDRVAHREVADTLIGLEERISLEIQKTYGSISTERKVYHKGFLREFPNQRSFNEFLSENFDEIYKASPIFKNELLNRNKISASITLARKRLLENLLENRGERDLGYEETDFSADATLFRLCLKATGIYGAADNPEHHDLKNPTQEKWLAVWEELNQYINERLDQDIQVRQLVDHFKAPPYGIRENVFSLFLIFYIESAHSGLALYEEGTYVPIRDEISYEILLKRPHLFSIRRVSCSENHLKVFHALSSELGLEQVESVAIDAVYRVLQGIYTKYSAFPRVTRNTRQLEDTTRQVRDLIERSNRPEQLLLQDLPKALNIDPEKLVAATNAKLAKKYAKALKSQLDILASFYPTLLNDSLEKVFQIFGFHTPEGSDDHKQREVFSKRLESIRELTSDAHLLNFIQKVTNTTLKWEAWVEQTLGVVFGKKCTVLTDLDITELDNKARSLARVYQNCSLLLDNEKDFNLDNLVRFNLTCTRNGVAEERVLNIEEDEEISKIKQEIAKELKIVRQTEKKEAILLSLLSDLMNEKRRSEQCQISNEDIS